MKILEAFKGPDGIYSHKKLLSLGFFLLFIIQIILVATTGVVFPHEVWFITGTGTLGMSGIRAFQSIKQEEISHEKK
jgi:hypothetical protein